MSVTLISHRLSIGAPTKPCKILFAIHWPLLRVYGAQTWFDQSAVAPEDTIAGVHT